jgi:tetratricopeptide (TPR) repeat protein
MLATGFAHAQLGAPVVITPGAPIDAIPAPPPPATPLQIASRQLRRGEAAVALATIDAFLRNEPASVPGRFLRGVILTELKRSDEAIDVFTRLTQEEPQLTEPYNNLAVLYAAGGEPRKALAALEQAIANNIENVVAHENLGDLYGQFAARSYERALALAPGSRTLRAKLALIRELGQTQRAPRASAESDSPNDGEKK